MRNTYLLTLTLLITAFLPFASAKTFEGQYEMAFTGDGENITMSFWVKGGHMRMKAGGKAGQMGEMILREGMSSMIILMPQQGMYMEMPIPQDAIASAAKPKDLDELPFKRTGNKKEILGYTAHEFVYENEKDKMTIWATDAVGSMPFANNPMLQGWTQTMQQLTGLKSFFPLETVGTRRGKKEFKMTVLKIEQKSLPDSLFLPPEGLRKMTLPAGMGGLLPGG